MTEQPDPLERLWSAFDIHGPLVSAQETVWWPPGAFAYLIKARFLAPAEPASQVVCRACGDQHVEEVQATRRGGGRLRYFIWCPESGRVEIDASNLRQWRPNFGRLARKTKELLNIKNRVSDPEPDRLWRLGTTMWKGSPRLVYFARGLHWPDGPTIAAKIPVENRPIILVGIHFAPPSMWPGLSLPIVPLAPLMTVEQGQLSLNVPLLVQWVANSDQAAARAGSLADSAIQGRVDRFAEKRMAEGGKMDIIKAFQSMSSGKLAAELTARGMPTHRSTVWRKRSCW